MSVKENVVLNQKYDYDSLKSAIDKSGLRDKVAKLDKGIDTQIEKRFDDSGIEFSGGEKQKLACARAYYKDAPITILDEPTASLDPFAESQLYERFNNIIKNKTAIFISHRLASVKFCDKVAVFVNGEIVEYGTHLSLLSNKGVYAEMFEKQAESYLEESEETE